MSCTCPGLAVIIHMKFTKLTSVYWGGEMGGGGGVYGVDRLLICYPTYLKVRFAEFKHLWKCRRILSILRLFKWNVSRLELSANSCCGGCELETQSGVLSLIQSYCSQFSELETQRGAHNLSNPPAGCPQLVLFLVWLAYQPDGLVMG